MYHDLESMLLLEATTLDHTASGCVVDSYPQGLGCVFSPSVQTVLDPIQLFLELE